MGRWRSVWPVCFAAVVLAWRTPVTFAFAGLLLRHLERRSLTTAFRSEFRLLVLRDATHNNSDNGDIIPRENGNETGMFTKEEPFLPDAHSPPSPVVLRKRGRSSSNPKMSSGEQQQSGSASSYKVLDNRDSLPFAVEIVTPDPYTHPDIKRKMANKVKRQKGNNIIASSLFTSNDTNNDNDSKTHLGEFELDKHTTTGDLLEIANRQYRVVQHRCQYKYYAGGKGFVMVRKILHVKEITRLQTEEYLARQWKK